MSSTPVKHVALTPRKKVDHKENLPEAYITFNQALLDDEKWTYRDLQKLAMKLNIGSRGTRAELIDRLLEWHKRQFNSGRRCAGSNFALLEVELPPSPAKDVNGNSAKQAGVSPTLLSPLKSKPKRNNDGTPISILSATKKPQSDKKKIAFSIFNGTKIIPPRDAIRRKWLEEDGIDPDAESESEDEYEFHSIEQEIAASSAPSPSISRTFTNDGLTSAAEEDWLTSEISLPTNSPYHGKVAPKSPVVISRKCNFDDDNTADPENIPAMARPAPVNAAGVINTASKPFSSFNNAATAKKNALYSSNAFLKNTSKYNSSTLTTSTLGKSTNTQRTQADALEQEFIQGIGALSM